MVKNPGAKIRTDRLRALAGPRDLRVEVDDRGHPQQVLFEGAMRAVTSIQDRWRIDDEWWRDQPISRMYYQLQLEGDRIVTIYADLITSAWRLQRY